jgi:hypothetical protein
MRSFEEYALEASQNPTRLRSEWTAAEGLEIYCRRSIRYPGVIIMANIQAVEERQGYFTRFLNTWEDKFALGVEHPHNPHLKAFLLRRGWVAEEIWGDVVVYNDLAQKIISAKKSG